MGTVYFTCKIALYRTLGGGNYRKKQQKAFYISGSLPYYSYDSLLFCFFLQFESVKNKKRKSIKVTDDSFSKYKLVYFPCINLFWD